MATDDQNTDQPGTAGASAGNTDSNGSTPPKPVPVYTKDDLTRITTREVGAVREKLTAAEAELAKYREQEEAERNAKLSKEQREKEAREKERVTYDAKIAELTQQATTERTKRHGVLLAGKAASLASTIAAQVANPGLLPHVERSIAERLIVEVDGDGNERVVMRMGAAGDNEPLESGFPKFRDEHLTPFFKVATGSGAQHGAGAAGGRAKFAGLSPTDKIASGL